MRLYADQGNPGASKLGKVLAQRMSKQSESPLVLDYGSIEADYSLKTNTFPLPIPKSDYTVCRHVGGLSLGTNGGEHGGHESWKWLSQPHNPCTGSEAGRSCAGGVGSE